MRNFIVPIEFVVLDFEEDQGVPILLGRPFLATFISSIDLERNELAMKINGEIEVFKYDCDSQDERLDKKIGNDKINIFQFDKIIFLKNFLVLLQRSMIPIKKYFFFLEYPYFLLVF